MKRLAGYFRRFLRHRRQLLLGVLCIPVAGACDIALTVVVGDALTRLRGASDTAFLPRFFALLLAVALVQGVFRYLPRWWLVGLSRTFEVELKQELFDKLSRLSFEFHGRTRSGDLVSRVTSDVENVRMLLGPGLMYVLSALVMVPGSFVVLWNLSPKVTLAMMVPLVFVALAMRALTPRLHRHSTDVQESLAEISHRAQESFAGIRVVKGYGLEGHAVERFAEVSRKNRDHQNLLGSARGLSNSLVHLAYDMAFLPVLFVGGLLMVDRTLEVGDLFKFIDLGFKVFWPVIALGWIAGLLPRALASAERIGELLDQETRIAEPSTARTLAPVKGALSLRHVSFRYADSPRLALADVSLEVPAGTTLGVVGPTGAGKTTLLLALGRLHDVEGTIALDGVPIREIPLGILRGALAYVPQDSFLFSAPYRENVEFGADAPLPEEVLERVTELAGMRTEVESLPGRFDQLIGERGVTLSGGQRQRTCIARALAKDPKILVLDDAMSAVDTDTEARLLESLRAERRGRTVVVAAHRLASVRHADRIAVLREGRLDALGTHAELLLSNRWYRETWNRQRTKEELERL